MHQSVYAVGLTLVLLAGITLIMRHQASGSGRIAAVVHGTAQMGSKALGTP